jgi:hypothetical protein
MINESNIIVPYEFAHQPDLFKFTKTGKVQELRRTAGETQGGAFGQLSKAGATALGIDTNVGPLSPNQLAKTSQTPLTNGTTSHWKSNYTAAIEDNIDKPILKGQRPEWSLPRAAYSSKRTFFFTE